MLEKKSLKSCSLPFFKVLPGKTSYSIIFETNLSSFRRNYRIDAHNEKLCQASNEANSRNEFSLFSRNYIEENDSDHLESSIQERSWNGIKLRKLTQQEKHFSSQIFVQKHPNFAILNPVYSLSQIFDSKLMRIWTMLYSGIEKSAKNDLIEREINLFYKWELATIVLSKENQNGPMSEQMLHLLEIKVRRLPSEIEQMKLILLNFLNTGIQHESEFLKSQITHGSSAFSVLTHYDHLVANLSDRLGSMQLDNFKSQTAFTDRIAWIASKLSCSHTMIWSHCPVSSSSLQPHVIWKCPFNRASCDGLMASMLTKNVFFLDILCNKSCQNSCADKICGSCQSTKNEANE